LVNKRGFTVQFLYAVDSNLSVCLIGWRTSDVISIYCSNHFSRSWAVLLSYCHPSVRPSVCDEVYCG